MTALRLLLLCAAACAAAERDSVAVLARFGEIGRENASRLTNYVCVENIERRYYRAKLATTPRNCDELAAEKKRRGYKLTQVSSDRLRLDVRSTVSGEMYSWPGADRFEDRRLWDIIGYGPAATGPFGMSTLEVVQGDATDFAFLGETVADGRKLFRYSFRVPAERSHYYIHVGSDDVATSWDGILLIDPETSELVRMTTRTSELPREAFSCEIATSSDYGRVAIGSRNLPLSRETRQRFIDRSGEEVESVVTFSGCREYKAASRDSGGAAGKATEASESASAARSLDLPAGLQVTIELTSRIDSANAAAGDRFTGRVARPVRDLSDRTVIPKGSAVAGRLYKVAVQVQPPKVVIALHVDTVSINGGEVPVHLAGRFIPKGGWVREMLGSLTVGGRVGGASAASRGPINVVNPPPIEGEFDVLTFPGSSKVLEPGFNTEWVTVEP